MAETLEQLVEKIKRSKDRLSKQGDRLLIMFGKVPKVEQSEFLADNRDIIGDWLAAITREKGDQTFDYLGKKYSHLNKFWGKYFLKGKDFTSRLLINISDLTSNLAAKISTTKLE